MADIDFAGYVRARRTILNGDGGRGYERGVLVFDCPLCGDARGRGFINVQFRTAGCFNAGCVAEPRLGGGFVEWVRLVEGYASRAEALAFLHRAHPLLVETLLSTPRSPQPDAYDEWVRFPKAMHLVTVDSQGMQKRFTDFAKRKWDLNPVDLVRSGVGYCLVGRYRLRLIFPVVINRKVVGFQARSITNAEPKYLTSRRGAFSEPQAECGRAAESWLWGIDDLLPGGTAILVEGIPDAIRFSRDGAGLGTPIAMIGMALTSEKLAMLLAKKPGKVILALDTEEGTKEMAIDCLRRLESWGLPAYLGLWRGGKDAGSGARLHSTRASVDLLVRGITDHRLPVAPTS